MHQAVTDKYFSSPTFRKTSGLAFVLGIAGFILGIVYLAMPSNYFLFALGTAILLAAIFIKPEYGYYLTVLLLPVDMTQLFMKVKGTYYLFLIFPYIFILIPLLIAWGIFRLAGRREKVASTPVSAILPIMVLYLLVTIIWSPLPNLGLLLGVSLLLNYGLFYLTTGIVKDRASLDKMMNVVLLLGIITSAGVILSQWVNYKETMRWTNYIGFTINFGEILNRPAGFGSVDNMGGILSFTGFIAIGRLLASKGSFKKFVYFILTIFMAIGMILTVSRGALVGYVAGIFLLFILHPSIKNKIIKYGIITLFILSSTILIAKPGYIDRILIGFGYTGQLYFTEGKTTTTENYDASKVGLSGLDQRKVWWKNAFNEMLKHYYKLIVGLGIGGFIYYGGTIATHSVPLSFFFDMGAIGAIFLLIFSASLCREFYHYIKYGNHHYTYYVFIAAVVAFFAEVGVHGLIDYDFYSYTARMFWFPLGYVCAVLNVVKAENSNLNKTEENYA